jgi:hypothetical protein
MAGPTHKEMLGVQLLLEFNDFVLLVPNVKMHREHLRNCPEYRGRMR